MAKRALQMPSAGDLVLVRWEDIQTDHGWDAPDKDGGLAHCQTVGWVCSVTARAITVAACVGDDPSSKERESNLRMSIPRGCVTGWDLLRKGAKAGA